MILNQAEPITPGVNPASLPSVDMLLSSVNIADSLDDDVLRKIGNTVVDGFEADEASRSEWMKRYENSLKLATQIVEHKSFPWQGAANIKYPLLTTACIQFSARAYPALITGQEIVLARTTGFDPDGMKTAKASRISRHMSYQVLEEMEEWEEDMDRLLVMLPCTGTEFKKSWYDPIRGRNVSEHVLARELVVNYWAKSLETAVRKTHILYLTPNDIRERVLAGLFLDQDLKRSNITADNIRSISDTVQGLSPPFDDEDAPFRTLECHTWLDLDKDDYKEPYIVTLDHESRKVLRITSRFDQDGVTYGKKNKVLRIKPVEYFTKFSFIPSLDGGFYDFGWGHLLGPINETVNTTINQLLDAGTLSNMQSGFLSRGIRLRGGDSKFKPGEWKMVDTTGDDLRKGIFPMPVQQPSNVLFQLLGTMTQAGERLSNVVDILMGENPGQNQPATTTMAVIEQGLKVFTAVYKRLFRSLKYEYRKLYRLNRVYLPQEVYFRVLDMEQGEMMQIGQGDYQGDPTDVQPAADPNMVSESQRLVRAQALVSSLREGSPANPLEIWKRYYEAMRIENPEKLLPKELPPPAPGPEARGHRNGRQTQGHGTSTGTGKTPARSDQGPARTGKTPARTGTVLPSIRRWSASKPITKTSRTAQPPSKFSRWILEREREENRLAIEKLKIESQERVAVSDRESMEKQEKGEKNTVNVVDSATAGPLSDIGTAISDMANALTEIGRMQAETAKAVTQMSENDQKFRTYVTNVAGKVFN